MTTEPDNQPNLSPEALTRRKFLRIAGISGASLFMGSAVLSVSEIIPGMSPINAVFEPLNQSLEALLLSQKPVPEFPFSAIEPTALLENTYRFTPNIQPETFRLVVDGEVQTPMTFNLDTIYKMPYQSMVIRHVCVEGWAAIVQWGGLPMRELIKLVQPKQGVKYVYFYSADGYYESWDLASVVHPQTLLAYQKNGEPLSADFGAPLRLASPIKLGYKLSKWVTRIAFTSRLLPKKGYWEDQGYEWFAGL